MADKLLLEDGTGYLTLEDGTGSYLLESNGRLYLRNTTTNGISIGGVPCYDLSTTPGSSPDTAVTDTTNGGTEIQFTKTAGGSVAAFITGRVPAGGWTITSSDVALWLNESASTVNAGLRFRLFKYSGGTETELGGSPFSTGTEFNTANTLETLLGNVTDTALAEDDRLLLRIYTVNVGTMAVGTATLNFNGTSGGTAPVFRSSSTVTAASGSLSYPQPSGAAVGDFVLFAWTCFGPGTVGYASTMVGTTQNNQSGPDGEDTGFAGRILDGTETWPFVVTFSGGADRTGICAAFQYVNKDNPFDVTPSYTEAQGSIPTPITTASSGIAASPKSTLVWLANTDQTVAADRWSYSTPSGFTMREDVHSINWAHLALATQENFAGGFTNSITATATRDSGTGNAGWAGYVIALRAIQAESYINVSPVIAFKAEGGGSAQNLTAPLTTNSQTFYPASVSAGAASVTPPLLTNNQSFPAATVNRGAVGVTAPLVSNSNTVFEPVVIKGAVDLLPPVLGSSLAVYSPTVSVGVVEIAPPLVTNTQSFHSPVVSSGQVLFPELLVNSQVFYAPTVIRNDAELQPPLLVNNQSFYTPTVAAGGNDVVAPLVTNTNTVFAPSITIENHIAAPLVVNTNTVFAPATSLAAYQLTAGMVVNSQSFLVPTITTSVDVVAGLVSNNQTFFGASIATGATTIVPQRVSNQQTFFIPTVTGGVPPDADSGFYSVFERRRRREQKRR